MDTTEAAVQYRLQKWTNIFMDRKQSGMTVNQYCEANHISRDSYYYWYKRVRATALQQVSPSIIPIGTTSVMEQDPAEKTASPACNVFSPATLTLQVGDISLKVNEATPDMLLRRTLRILLEVK